MTAAATTGDPGGSLRELLRAGRFADVLAAFRAEDSDLVRARWMTRVGYRLLLK
ncbi:MAG: hypothetical protein ACREOF_11155 [Gemmatimonadales bacterium]